MSQEWNQAGISNIDQSLADAALLDRVNSTLADMAIALDQAQAATSRLKAQPYLNRIENLLDELDSLQGTPLPLGLNQAVDFVIIQANAMLAAQNLPDSAL